MSSISDFLEQKSLDKAYNNVDFTIAETYVALFTTDPTDAGSGTELAVANGYARARVYPSSSGSTPKWNPAASEGGGGHQITNANDVVFTASGGAWSAVSHWAVVDSSSGSFNVLDHGTIDNTGGTPTPRTLQDGDSLTFASGAIKVIRR